MTQQELGEACGITFQQIQKNERGVNRISAGRLVQMAKVLRRPLAYFYEGLEGPTRHAEARDPISLLADSRQGFALARAFTSIDDDELRASLVSMIETLAAGRPPLSPRLPAKLDGQRSPLVTR